jgi:hypothetical protein
VKRTQRDCLENKKIESSLRKIDASQLSPPFALLQERTGSHVEAQGEMERDVLVMEVNPDTLKIRILWSTNESRQHQMLASYDQVLTAVVRTSDSFGSEPKRRSAA